MKLLERIARAFPEHPDSWVEREGHPDTRPLPFYSDAVEVDIRNDRQDPESKSAYVVSEDAVFYLDGSLEAIMRVNEAQKLKLGRDQVADYLRFVFSNVGKGKLQVMEHAADMPWSDEAKEEPLLSKLIDDLGALVHPIEVSDAGKRKHGAVLTGLFKDILVKVEVEVGIEGALKPLSQQPLAKDLPVRVRNGNEQGQ